MTPTTMNSRVAKMMKGTHYKRIENTLEAGTPDTDWCNGQAELKTIEKWNKKADTIFRIDDFSPDQRRWLKRRCKYGGRAFLLLHCQGDWLLFWGTEAGLRVGIDCTKEMLFDLAIVSSRGKLNEKEFRKCLLYYNPGN